MVVNSLPPRPLILSEVGYLSDTSEKIADPLPLSVLELGGLAEIVVSFVMSTFSPAYFGLVFEREDDAWKAVFKEFYENEGDAHEGFHNAIEVIMGYWQDDASMEKTGKMATPDNVAFDEYTITNLDKDAYVEYFK